jgi:hypothetical protein
MDFAFSPEQDDLRREARAFLEANPAPTMDQMSELGWVGILKSDDFTFIDAAVLFEELGRALYEGPYVLNEVAALSAGDLVVHVDHGIGRFTGLKTIEAAGARTMPTAAAARLPVDETLGLAASRRTAASPRPVTGGRAAATAAALALRGGRHRHEGARARHGAHEGARSSVPIGGGTRRPHAVVEGTSASSSAARSRTGPRGASPRATAGGAGCSRGEAQATEAAVAACERSIQVHGGIGFTWSTRSTATTSAHSGSRARSGTAASSAPRWLVPAVLVTGASSGSAPPPRSACATSAPDRLASVRTAGDAPRRGRPSSSSTSPTRSASAMRRRASTSWTAWS